MKVIGVDIGGTKCVVSLGEARADGSVQVLHRCETRATAEAAPMQMLEALAQDIRHCKTIAGADGPKAIGISCGGPLDSRRGRILSPPNLPGWDDIPITSFFEEKIGLPAWICNDANACALAEWKMGAGRGCRNMVFMTFGTGLGAGLILDGRLYEGTSDMAGELGHIRLASFGPVGYGKMGSFEGFCSGGGIAQLAQTIIREELQQGRKPALCPSPEELSAMTAEKVGKAAKCGDELAQKILNQVGRQLGVGLSVVIDLLNPERIVIGGVFARCCNEIWPAAAAVIESEALPQASSVCSVVPCGLGEAVGDVAALMVAVYHLEQEGI